MTNLYDFRLCSYIESVRFFLVCRQSSCDIQSHFQLMVFDVNSRHMDQIPALHSGENSAPAESDCGIHAIEINPSRFSLITTLHPCHVLKKVKATYIAVTRSPRVIADKHCFSLNN